MGSAVKLGGGGGANGSADRTNSGIGIGGGSTLAGPDENTPLINGHSGSDGNGDGPGFWRQVLLDPRHTPGTDSSNHAVRYSAHVFNVTKATLLSSMSHPANGQGKPTSPVTMLFC